ncbi:hypothetical protein LCGC14_3023170, partial [marine sediment metagenome]
MRVTYKVHSCYGGRSRFYQADYIIDAEDGSAPTRIIRSTKRTNKKAAETVAWDQARKFEEEGLGAFVHREVSFKAFAAGRVEALDLKPSVKRDYESRMTAHIIPFFGEKKVASITYETIERFDLAMKAGLSGGRRKPLKRITRKHMLTVLNKVLERATRPPRRILAVNPVREYVAAKDDPRVDIHKPRGPKRVPLNEAQLERYIAAALEMYPLPLPWGVMLILAPHFGPRRGELYALLWEDWRDGAEPGIEINKSWDVWVNWPELPKVAGPVKPKTPAGFRSIYDPFLRPVAVR